MIGTLEIILILISIAIVYHGNRRLKILKKVGKFINEFRKMRI